MKSQNSFLTARSGIYQYGSVNMRLNLNKTDEFFRPALVYSLKTFDLIFDEVLDER